MRALRIVALMAAVVVALLVLGVVAVSAQGPVANLTPANAPYIDNQSHPIPAGSSSWFRFDYQVNNDTGERPITTITLPNGLGTGLTFDVWTQNGIADVVNNTPVGKDSPVTVSQDGIPTPTGDLNWVGAFGASGSYYVRVTNPNTQDTTAQLTISGDGVRLAPVAVTGSSASQPTAAPTAAPTTAAQPTSAPTSGASQPAVAPTAPPTTAAQPTSAPSGASQPAAAPTAAPTTYSASQPTAAPTISSLQPSVSATSALTTTQTATSMDDPSKAVPLDGTQQSIPANSALWFTFSYTNTATSGTSAPAVHLKLANGNVSGVGFQLFSSDMLANWSQATPIGTGTSTSQSADLDWTGNLASSGTFYVRVFNNTTNPIQVTLTLQTGS